MALELYLVCYDIESDRDRNWVAKTLGGHGVRVQESVFECYVEEGTASELIGRFRERLAEGDEVAFYPLCRRCGAGVRTTSGRGVRRVPAFVVF